MKITFLGVGSAFTTPDYYQSNMLLTTSGGKSLLIDCGADIRHALREYKLLDEHIGAAIDAVYISHCHSDHIGGLEYLALTTYFSDKRGELKLFAEKNIMRKLWDESLKGGLCCIQGKSMGMYDYFHCHPMRHNALFQWEEIRFALVGMPHIIYEDTVSYSYGLLIGGNDPAAYHAFISTDSQFRPDIISLVARQVQVIFHDCETLPFKTGVHAHYDELLTLPVEVRNNMWLYHYNPNPAYDPKADGFRGFVKKGQEFRFG